MSSPVTPLARTVPSEEEYPSVHLLLLITGSVAAVKTGLLLDQLSTERCNIRIAATKAAFHFLRRAQPSMTGIPFHSIITDEQEWSEWQAMNDSVVHIELRRWADLVVIAPLNANTLAKVANGLCDNLVSSVMRAWEVRQKPVIVCPAMNTAMWMHPITGRQLDQMAEWYSDADVRGTASWSTMIAASLSAMSGSSGSPATLGSASELKMMNEEQPQQPPQPAPPGRDAAASDAAKESVAASAPVATLPSPATLPATLRECMYQVVGPVSKRLACGDIGVGGMASVGDIARHIRHTMELIREVKRQRFRAERARRAAEGEATGAAAPTTAETAATAAVEKAPAPQPPAEAPPVPAAPRPASVPAPALAEPAPQHSPEAQSAPIIFSSPAMAKAYKGNMPVKKRRAR